MMEAGLEIYAHMGVRLNHAGISDETRPFFMQMGMEKSRKMQAVVGLTPNEMDVHQYLLERKMKETEEKVRTRPQVIHDAYVQTSGNQDLTLMTTPYKDAIKV
jgi:hypothetical protein